MRIFQAFLLFWLILAACCRKPLDRGEWSLATGEKKQELRGQQRGRPAGHNSPRGAAAAGFILKGDDGNSDIRSDQPGDLPTR